MGLTKDLVKSSCVSMSQKQENTTKNCFRIPMHFRTNRFTFKKFPTQPLLLHPNNQSNDLN